ncbi:MAG: response regulator [Candidatus Buchananbacteria bacterium]
MPKKKIKILIVEDEPMILDMYQTKLTQSGFAVIKAEDGAAGISLAQLELPNLILLDILMPKIDGYEMLKTLKTMSATKDIPVIIFSNLSQPNEVEKGLQLGANDFIIKSSVTPNEIANKVNNYLTKNYGKTNC